MLGLHPFLIRNVFTATAGLQKVAPNTISIQEAMSGMHEEYKGFLPKNWSDSITDYLKKILCNVDYPLSWAQIKNLLIQSNLTQNLNWFAKTLLNFFASISPFLGELKFTFYMKRSNLSLFFSGKAQTAAVKRDAEIGVAQVKKILIQILS